MTTQNTGGPAFPSGLIEPATPEDAIQALEKGMSLRDYFAAKAMQGMLSCPLQCASDSDMLARDSYFVADALLKARDGR